MARQVLVFASVIVLAPLAAQAQVQTAPPVAKSRTFVGAARCRPCHPDVYASWQKTRMANVVRDPKAHPEAVLGDFEHPDPLRTFDLSQVAFVYGSRWKQRYFAKQGDDYYPLPAPWDIKNKNWTLYHVEKNADWWVPYYGEDNKERPTGPLCDGCHSVETTTSKRRNLQRGMSAARKCHGPGSEHIAGPRPDNIVNPAKLDFVRANDVCMQCHSQGRPLSNPNAGHYEDWPVGFIPGERLADFWKLEEEKFGVQDFNYFQDGTAHNFAATHEAIRDSQSVQHVPQGQDAPLGARAAQIVADRLT